MTSRHATVLGGGIGGLTAAAALARHGWSVRLHERQPEIRALGAGIYLWDNGLFALDTIGALTEAADGAHKGPAFEVRAGSGKQLYRIPVNGEGQPRNYALLRDKLITALHKVARDVGVDLVTSSAAVAARPDGTVEFEGGGSESADLVVVADGVHSRVRDSLDLPYRRIRMTQGAARALVPSSPDYLPQADAAKSLEYFHGRRRFLYTPMTSESAYLAFTCDQNDAAMAGGHLDVRAWSRSFPQAARLVEAAAEVPLRWDTFEFIQLAGWSRGKVALLGDAAHAQPPYLGQGGGTAMTNAIALAENVSRRHVSLNEALRSWEASNRPAVEKTQRSSYRMRLLNPLPDRLRDPLLTAIGRSRGFIDSQVRSSHMRPRSSGN
ncbi:FAD-dependent oxidoreductase [Amycolatopsis jejuensis]|uniref:FAD-dependent oxidoreductase n=1 Tax=Amycolatopsis jejuensis TaxID=330084 RepID=UPI0005252994|nr:NAD(P)/FAD-dependent oxidoreductase [Amycolatopsis jejuensis]